MSISAYNLRVKGQVQGVGFRPFVYNLAARLGVCGFVKNGPQGVVIHAQAETALLTQFKQRLLDEQPSMSLIETIDMRPAQVVPTLTDFSIKTSETGALDLGVTPDAAVCRECLAELYDPHNRRYRYPFINCTHCGPRYSLIKALPYDRKHTTMADFAFCQPCLDEYKAADNRRFHAQPNACATCGPTLFFHNAKGEKQASIDPIAETLEVINRGGIVAIKGIGGFHLACDGRNDEAVKRLRVLKQRGQKPFAIMAANPASLAPYIDLTVERTQRLQAMDAPIVLCPIKENQSSTLSKVIAPQLAWMGVMLPHSPVHHLLFHKAAGEPTGLKWLDQPQALLLVMTSANRCGNPLLIDNQKALTELTGIADGFLLHNRDIYVRCDDSVVSAVGEKPRLIRRGRGLSPQFIPLSCGFSVVDKSVLAVGSFFKNTLCLTKGDRAYVSQYMGDLDNPECCRALHTTVEHLTSLLGIKPDLVVSDLHPDFYSTQFAEHYSQEHSIPLIKVQHHHAHIASVVAEHQIKTPVLGVALDGFGLGLEGELWGGELLYVHQGEFTRLAHLSPLTLPGGERAAKEPWRMAAAALYDLGRGEEISQRFADQPGADLIGQLLDKQLNCPTTTSAGRLFDTVAGLLGITTTNQYEAQAAMMLESLAYTYLQNHPWPEASPLIESVDGNLNCAPLLAAISDCEDAGYGAALFHQQLIDGLARWISEQSQRTAVTKVVLAGGCFLNALLTDGVTRQLQANNIDLYCAEKLPCNDGGIALGQAHIALEMEVKKSASFDQNSLNKNNTQLQTCNHVGQVVSDSAVNSAEIKRCV